MVFSMIIHLDQFGLKEMELHGFSLVYCFQGPRGFGFANLRLVVLLIFFFHDCVHLMIYIMSCRFV